MPGWTSIGCFLLSTLSLLRQLSGLWFFFPGLLFVLCREQKLETSFCMVVLLYFLWCWHVWRCCCLCSDCWLVFLVAWLYFLLVLRLFLKICWSCPSCWFFWLWFCCPVVVNSLASASVCWFAIVILWLSLKRRYLCQNLHCWVTQSIAIPPHPNPHTTTVKEEVTEVQVTPDTVTTLAFITEEPTVWSVWSLATHERTLTVSQDTQMERKLK